MDTDTKIVITGGAGLVGQNLVVMLSDRGYRRLTVVDKSAHNLALLGELHPHVETIPADLAEAGAWQGTLVDADVVVILHAQIGGLSEREFERNNVNATSNLLAALHPNPDCYLLHVSSSVIHSTADDYYTRSKLAQEVMVTQAPNPWFILRPTLMFGWFDRKHFGWLSRFMKKFPLFPVPGDGNYLRQPLFAGDFCSILLACIERRPAGEIVDISGTQKVAYIEIIRQIRKVVGSRALLLHIPVWAFSLLLRVYALFDRDPPFTHIQLAALVIDEMFESIDWETRFELRATPLHEALEQTFTFSRYSDVVLEF